MDYSKLLINQVCGIMVAIHSTKAFGGGAVNLDLHYVEYSLSNFSGLTRYIYLAWSERHTYKFGFNGNPIHKFLWYSSSPSNLLICLQIFGYESDHHVESCNRPILQMQWIPFSSFLFKESFCGNIIMLKYRIIILHLLLQLLPYLYLHFLLGKF